MSPDAQRIAIAELCGWFPAERGVKVWYDPEGGHVVFNDLPDYPNDLNAMHQAEQCLTNKQYHTFTLMLSDASWRAFPSQTDDDAYKSRLRATWSADAPSRAECLLRAIGLWDDSK